MKLPPFMKKLMCEVHVEGGIMNIKSPNKSSRIVYEGLIKDCDNYPATQDSKWFCAKNGRRYRCYVYLKGQEPEYRAVEVEDPQKLSIVNGVLVEQKTYPNGQVYDVPVIFKAGEVSIETVSLSESKCVFKERLAVFFRRVFKCTNHSERT